MNKFDMNKTENTNQKPEVKNAVTNGTKNKMEIPYSRVEKDNIWTVPQ